MSDIKVGNSRALTNRILLGYLRQLLYPDALKGLASMAKRLKPLAFGAGLNRSYTHTYMGAHMCTHHL